MEQEYSNLTFDQNYAQIVNRNTMPPSVMNLKFKNPIMQGTSIDLNNIYGDQGSTFLTQTQQLPRP